MRKRGDDLLIEDIVAVALAKGKLKSKKTRESEYTNLAQGLIDGKLGHLHPNYANLFASADLNFAVPYLKDVAAYVKKLPGKHDPRAYVLTKEDFVALAAVADKTSDGSFTKLAIGLSPAGPMSERLTKYDREYLKTLFEEGGVDAVKEDLYHILDEVKTNGLVERARQLTEADIPTGWDIDLSAIDLNEDVDLSGNGAQVDGASVLSPEAARESAEELQRMLEEVQDEEQDVDRLPLAGGEDKGDESLPEFGRRKKDSRPTDVRSKAWRDAVQDHYDAAERHVAAAEQAEQATRNAIEAAEAIEEEREKLRQTQVEVEEQLAYLKGKKVDKEVMANIAQQTKKQAGEDRESLEERLRISEERVAELEGEVNTLTTDRDKYMGQWTDAAQEILTRDGTIEEQATYIQTLEDANKELATMVEEGTVDADTAQELADNLETIQGLGIQIEELREQVENGEWMVTQEGIDKKAEELYQPQIDELTRERDDALANLQAALNDLKVYQEREEEPDDSEPEVPEGYSLLSEEDIETLRGEAPEGYVNLPEGHTVIPEIELETLQESYTKWNEYERKRAEGGQSEDEEPLTPSERAKFHQQISGLQEDLENREKEIAGLYDQLDEFDDERQAAEEDDDDEAPISEGPSYDSSVIEAKDAEIAGLQKANEELESKYSKLSGRWSRTLPQLTGLQKQVAELQQKYERRKTKVPTTEGDTELEAFDQINLDGALTDMNNLLSEINDPHGDEGTTEIPTPVVRENNGMRTMKPEDLVDGRSRLEDISVTFEGIEKEVTEEIEEDEDLKRHRGELRLPTIEGTEENGDGTSSYRDPKDWGELSAMPKDEALILAKSLGLPVNSRTSKKEVLPKIAEKKKIEVPAEPTKTKRRTRKKD